MTEPMTDMPDAKLLANWPRFSAEERRKGFCVLYERHAALLQRYLLRLSRSEHLAEDLVQDAFVKALDGLSRFDGRSSFRTWLHTIATNLFRDHCRRKNVVTCEDETLTQAQDSGPCPAGQVVAKEREEQVRSCFDSIPESLRQPLMLVRLQGLKYAEAAKVLGLSIDTVRMRVHRAHLHLAQDLKKQGVL